MKFAINLALAPRENRRRVWIAWGGALALSFAALLVLATATAATWRAAGAARRGTARLRTEMPALQVRRDELAAELSAPAAAQQMDRARALNALIDRKAVSWTRLFERLEALLPGQVQLLGIGPAQGGINSAGRIAITVAAADIPAALPFVANLEDAPDFSAPRVRTVTDHRQRKTSAPVTLNITVAYRPPKNETFFGRPATEAPAATAAAGAVPPHPGGRP